MSAAPCLRRPILFACPKRIGRKTTIKGRAFYQAALPLIIPSSYVRNRSYHKQCQQCTTRKYVPINTTHFSTHSASRCGTVTFLWLIRTVLTNWHPCRQTNNDPSFPDQIYDILNEQKKKGTGVLFIGEDLDVMLALCDKIMVLCHGKNMGIVHAKKTTKEEIGLMMTGSLNLSESKNKEYGKARDSRLSEEEWLELEKRELTEENGGNDNG